MVFTPDQPFPKARGQVIKSKDWNDAVTEIQRLDSAKVNKAGDNVAGPLTVAGNVGAGTSSPQERLQVGSGIAFHDGGHKVIAFGWSPATNKALQVGVPGEIRWAPNGSMSLGVDTQSRQAGATPAIGTALSVLGGNVGIKNTNPQRALQIGGETSGVGLSPSDASPNAGYVRWGDNTGWRLHFGRSKESPSGDLNTGTAGILMTLQDNVGVGIGTPAPNHRFHVVAPDAVGLFESSGAQAYLRLSTNEGIDNRVEVTNRPGGRLSLWTSGGGDALNVLKNGNVGIGTTGPEAKLHVVGGDIRLEGNRIFYSPGRMHINGEEILYILNKSGVNISRAWQGNGNLHVDGEVRLGAGDAPVHIGGNRSGAFMQLNDDLWFSDPQNGSIEIKNGANNNWGTLVGIFNNKSSIKYKKDVAPLAESDLSVLLDDALGTDVVRYRYTGDDDAARLRLGVITENCPRYLVGEDGESLSSTEYTAMVHAALKALADRVVKLEGARATERKGR